MIHKTSIRVSLLICAISLGACNAPAPQQQLTPISLDGAQAEARNGCAVLETGSRAYTDCLAEWTRLRMGGTADSRSMSINLGLVAAHRCSGMGMRAGHSGFAQCVAREKMAMEESEDRQRAIAAAAAAMPAPVPAPVIVQQNRPIHCVAHQVGTIVAGHCL